MYTPSPHTSHTRTQTRTQTQSHTHTHKHTHTLTLTLTLQDLNNMEHDADLLDKMWSLVHEWQGHYNTWKDGSFADIKVRAEKKMGMG